ncbi:MAG: HIT family protein [Anaerolineae bacterium]|nr:HIT family protein [Anaerolineae bacterium]
MTCIFCEILARRAPGSFIFEDDLCAAFMDIHPVTTGHLLVVPRRHAASLSELDPLDGERLFRVGQRCAAALRASGLPAEGVNFFLADGAAAGQDVFHVHLHVFPRFSGDGFGLRFPPGYGAFAARDELDEIASRLRDQWLNQ